MHSGIYPGTVVTNKAYISLVVEGEVQVTATAAVVAEGIK